MPTFVADELVTAAKLNAATARDWTTWAPTYVNLTVGNGTVVARYVQVGKLVMAAFSFVFGSTSSIGAAEVSLPVAPNTALFGTDARIGEANLIDTGTNYYAGTVLVATTTTRVRIMRRNGDLLGSIGSTTPFTWVTGDVLMFTATYEAA